MRNASKELSKGEKELLEYFKNDVTSFHGYDSGLYMFLKEMNKNNNKGGDMNGA